MRKFLNNPWIVAALALAALACVGQSLWPGPMMTGSSATTPAIARATAAPAADLATPGPTPQSGDELAALTVTAVRRDPFAPSSKSPAVLAAVEKARPDALDTVHLSALWTQDGAIYAVINGSIFRPGDEIGRLRIESATTDGVWLVHWKGRDHLALGGDFTLRTPAAGPPALSSSNGPALSPSNGAVLTSL